MYCMLPSATVNIGTREGIDSQLELGITLEGDNSRSSRDQERYLIYGVVFNLNDISRTIAVA